VHTTTSGAHQYYARMRVPRERCAPVAPGGADERITCQRKPSNSHWLEPPVAHRTEFQVSTFTPPVRSPVDAPPDSWAVVAGPRRSVRMREKRLRADSHVFPEPVLDHQLDHQPLRAIAEAQTTNTMKARKRKDKPQNKMTVARINATEIAKDAEPPARQPREAQDLGDLVATPDGAPDAQDIDAAIVPEREFSGQSQIEPRERPVTQEQEQANPNHDSEHSAERPDDRNHDGGTDSEGGEGPRGAGCRAAAGEREVPELAKLFQGMRIPRSCPRWLTVILVKYLRPHAHIIIDMVDPEHVDGDRQEFIASHDFDAPYLRMLCVIRAVFAAYMSSAGAKKRGVRTEELIQEYLEGPQEGVNSPHEVNGVDGEEGTQYADANHRGGEQRREGVRMRDKVQAIHKLVGKGKIALAQAAAESRGTLSPNDPRVAVKMQTLFPARRPNESSDSWWRGILEDGDGMDASDVEMKCETIMPIVDEHFKRVLEKLRKNKAAGPSGISTELLQVICEDDVVRKAYMFLVNAINMGKWIPSLVRDARAVALRKNDEPSDDPSICGCRPIVCGESLLKLAQTVLVSKIKLEAVQHLMPRDEDGNLTYPLQTAVSMACGAEWIVHNIRHEMDAADSYGVAADMRNAFNTIDKTAVLHGLRKYAPAAVPHFIKLNEEVSDIAFGDHTIKCSTLRQGDVSSPIFFALGFQWIMEQLDTADYNVLVAFMDDFYLIDRDPSHALKALMHLMPILERFGLVLNLDKTKKFTLVPQHEIPDLEACLTEGQSEEWVRFINAPWERVVKVLGAFIGDRELVLMELKKTMGAVVQRMHKLMELLTVGHLPIQDAYLLMRFSVCPLSRLAYLMRVMPAELMLLTCGGVDKEVLRVGCCLMGVPYDRLNEVNVALMGLPLKHGGLDFRSVEKYADYYYSRSLHNMTKEDEEYVAPPDPVLATQTFLKQECPLDTKDGIKELYCGAADVSGVRTGLLRATPKSKTLTVEDDVMQLTLRALCAVNPGVFIPPRVERRVEGEDAIVGDDGEVGYDGTGHDICTNLPMPDFGECPCCHGALTPTHGFTCRVAQRYVIERHDELVRLLHAN